MSESLMARTSRWVAGLIRLPVRARDFRSQINRLEDEVLATRLTVGRMLAVQVRSLPRLEHLRHAEFRVFSQFGEDGILQYLASRAIRTQSEEVFIEFGVGDYSEANTRFLLLNDNWRGLILDSDVDAMARLREKPLYWRHDLTAVGTFITRENVNDLFAKEGFIGDIGLLSIDIDGMDYWVWEAVNVVRPIVVVCEYNAVFGSERALTVPYDPAFRRDRAHFSHLYWGASLRAMTLLGERKGYVFVGTNGAANNAFFVRRDRAGELTEADPVSGFIGSRFRDSRDAAGRLNFLRGEKRRKEIAQLPVWNVERGILETLGDKD